MAASPSDDPIPSRVRDVLALFRSELGEQRFGDLDAAALDELAEHARACAREVERARAALESAQSSLATARDELTRRVEQALAYATVFAQGDEALSARLAALGGAGEQPPKRAKRPRKAASAQAAELPFEARGAA